MTMYLIHKNKKKNYIWRSKICVFFCSKQLPLNIKQKYEFLYHFVDRERVLSVVVGVVSFSVNKPLEFHHTTFSIT